MSTYKINLKEKKYESFLTKHQPKGPYELILSQANYKSIKKWFDSSSFTNNTALFITGPPGCGKTITTKVFCQAYNYIIKEFNAFDCRNKNTLVHKGLILASSTSRMAAAEKNTLVSKGLTF